MDLPDKFKIFTSNKLSIRGIQSVNYIWKNFENMSSDNRKYSTRIFSDNLCPRRFHLMYFEYILKKKKNLFFLKLLLFYKKKVWFFSLNFPSPRYLDVFQPLTTDYSSAKNHRYTQANGLYENTVNYITPKFRVQGTNTVRYSRTKPFDITKIHFPHTHVHALSLSFYRKCTRYHIRGAKSGPKLENTTITR